LIKLNRKKYAYNLYNDKKCIRVWFSFIITIIISELKGYWTIFFLDDGGMVFIRSREDKLKIRGFK